MSLEQEKGVIPVSDNKDVLITKSAYDERPTTVECPSHTTERKLMNRVDWHILPFVIVLYLLAFLDRVNIANAKSFHLSGDLGLEKTEYNTGSQPFLLHTRVTLLLLTYTSSALTIFFIPYVLFEVPSNILLKRFSPRIWLSGCMFAFGLITLLQGLVQNYAGLVSR